MEKISDLSANRADLYQTGLSILSSRSRDREGVKLFT